MRLNNSSKVSVEKQRSISLFPSMNRDLRTLPKGPASQIRAQATNSQQQQPLTATTTPSSSNTDAKNNNNNEKTIIISTVQVSRPYLTRQQIEFARKRTVTDPRLYEQRRNQIFHFLLKVCISLKYPMRCLESAMGYYQRYYLYNEFDVNSFYDIGITSLFITSKNEDTIKKLRDIILVGNQIRNNVMKPENAETYRRRILRIEFKLLETITFDFRNYHIEEFLVKIGKDLKARKDTGLLAWLIAIDSFQTDVGLKVPAHSISLSCLIIASKLEEHDLKFKPETYHSDENSVNEALLDLLDLYIHHFNFTSLASFHPDFKDKFLDIKLFYRHAKGLSYQDEKSLQNDEYFKERDFSNGERRYMLGNQKKRLYNEI